MWQYKTYGIPDELFLRKEDVPITKEEVRTIALSKARLKEGYTVIDIGCGSGSITVEAALIIGNEGKLYAIDKNESAIELTKDNLKRFDVKNVEMINADAEDVIEMLPSVDAIFVGGGINPKVIRYAYEKLKKDRFMVIDTILLESVNNVINTLKDLAKDIEIIQVIISKGKRTNLGTMLLARNPVTVIVAKS